MFQPCQNNLLAGLLDLAGEKNLIENSIHLHRREHRVVSAIDLTIS